MKKYTTCMENKLQKNVLGENLELCSNNPLTGWYRDGCCNTDENDHGLHTVYPFYGPGERRSFSFNADIAIKK